mmetsp:Transcript_7651/g.21127  ORF Transcript_7651/g.21127 Transcript_7651/m.21127 type:complete len:221 (-) Transcript_7651:608-1270(-)
MGAPHALAIVARMRRVASRRRRLTTIRSPQNVRDSADSVLSTVAALVLRRGATQARCASRAACAGATPRQQMAPRGRAEENRIWSKRSRSTSSARSRARRRRPAPSREGVCSPAHSAARRSCRRGACTSPGQPWGPGGPPAESSSPRTWSTGHGSRASNSSASRSTSAGAPSAPRPRPPARRRSAGKRLPCCRLAAAEAGRRPCRKPSRRPQPRCTASAA